MKKTLFVIATIFFLTATSCVRSDPNTSSPNAKALKTLEESLHVQVTELPENEEFKVTGTLMPDTNGNQDYMYWSVSQAFRMDDNVKVIFLYGDNSKAVIAEESQKSFINEKGLVDPDCKNYCQSGAMAYTFKDECAAILMEEAQFSVTSVWTVNPDNGASLIWRAPEEWQN